MTAASTTTLPPSVETLREQLDDAAKHIGEQRERIKALEAEVAAHSAKTMTMVANHAALTDCLRDALRPFAEACEYVPSDQKDFKVIAHVPGGPDGASFNQMKNNLTAGNFRKARAVLSGEAK